MKLQNENIMIRSLTTYAVILLLALFFTADLKAQSKVGTTAAPFLTLGTGSRASALGHAYTASANGADALFWNVSGIAIPYEEKRGGVFFSNYQMFADIDYNAFGVAIPVSSKGVIGVRPTSTRR